MYAHLLFQREIGHHFKYQQRDPLIKKVQYSLCSNLSFCDYKEILSIHKAPVTTISIEHIENRYLLSGGSDCAIAIYDTLDTLQRENVQFKAIATLPKNVAHKYAISCVEWYTHDTGMFLSSSFDKLVKIWDTNLLKPAFHFKFGEKIYSISLSPIATQHCLVAVSGDSSRIRLCDLQSGSCAQTFVGHTDSIWSVKWSSVDEFLLASGGCDGTVRLWDIRRAGYLMCLDQFNTKFNPKTQNLAFSPKKFSPSKRVPTAHHGAITSLCFTPDGRYLLSSGIDNKIRMWDLISGKNTLVNYPEVKNVHRKSSSFCMSRDGSVLYHPNYKDVYCYDTYSGKLLKKLQAHYGVVNCCIYHPQDEMLFTAGNDFQIFMWTPEVYDRRDKHVNMMMDKDTWSD